MAISPFLTPVDEHGHEDKAHGTPSFPVACYHDDLTVDTVPWHWHEELEAAIVSEGKAIFATDQKEILLNTGEGCFINSDVLHAAWNSEKTVCRLHSIVFLPDLAGGKEGSVFWRNYLLPLINNHSFQMVKLSPKNPVEAVVLDGIEAAWKALATEPKGYEFAVRENLSKSLLNLSEIVSWDVLPDLKTSSRNRQRMKMMLDHIQSHLADTLTVETIAAAASVSPSECNRCFHGTIHTSPIQYVKGVRLQKASELLRTNDWKIEEVAEYCGFQDMSYFTRSFRAKFGMTPTEFRRGQKSH